MKHGVCILFACCAIQTALPGDIQLKAGGTLAGTIVSVVPATVTIRTATGTITMPVADLGIETIRTLPASVSAPYVRAADLRAKLAENSLDLALIQGRVNQIDSQYSNALVKCYFAGKEDAMRKQTGGVPAEVDARIRAKVEAAFPDDFYTQKLLIESERSAWLSLHNR